MRVLIAPDKYKHALPAPDVAHAIADGVRAAAPDAMIRACPLADGGEGSGRLLAQHLNAESVHTPALDPIGQERPAQWWYAPDTRTAIIEMAQASGIELLANEQRNPRQTTSYGTGQLIRAAIERGAERVLVCVGGSATVDGGAGCLQSLGWCAIDHRGQKIANPITGADLPRISALRPPANMPQTQVAVLTDVDNPLIGPRGAAPVFAPQKGADPRDVKQLTHGLEQWASILLREFGVDTRNIAGTGAAGGLPAALVAALGAEIKPGFAEIAKEVRFLDQLRNCDLCLTGEGRLDRQTAYGKVVAGVARLAHNARVPVIALVGATAGDSAEALAKALNLIRIIEITPRNTALQEALANTAQNLRSAAELATRDFISP